MCNAQNIFFAQLMFSGIRCFFTGNHNKVFSDKWKQKPY